MRTTSLLAAVVAATALALTACSSAETENPRVADPGAVDVASDESSAEPSAEPTVSPAIIERERVDRTPPFQVMRGTDRYAVNTADAIDGALGNLLTDKSNAFLRDHYLRRDRWAGKWYIKSGEIDAYREKVTPALFAEVDTALSEIQAVTEEYGTDSETWPDEVREAAGERTDVFKSLFFNNAESKGSGDIVYRSAVRHLFRATAGNGWESHLVGAPITYALVDVSREVGSDEPMRFGVWQAWEEVEGDWRVLDAGWRYLS